jgi:hypothetical protein
MKLLCKLGLHRKVYCPNDWSFFPIWTCDLCGKMLLNNNYMKFQAKVLEKRGL